MMERVPTPETGKERMFLNLESLYASAHSLLADLDGTSPEIVEEYGPRITGTLAELSHVRDEMMATGEMSPLLKERLRAASNRIGSIHMIRYNFQKKRVEPAN